MSLAFHHISWSVGVAILVANNSAFALNSPSVPVTAQSQLARNTTLAQDLEGEAELPEFEPGIDSSEEPRFTCEFFNGDYTVMYHPPSEPGEAYAWATPSAMGGGWTPESRCNEISRRLEFYRPDGLLELQTAVENSYDILCVTTQLDPSCRIVLTVPPGQDAELTRDRVFENLVVADIGQQTDAVNTFTGRGSGLQLLDQVFQEGLSALGIGGKKPTQRSGNINLQPFLDAADGGTGFGLPTDNQR